MLFLLLTFLLSLEAHAKDLAKFVSEGTKIRAVAMTEGHGVIWDFAFLPDNRIVFTERSGKIKILDPRASKITVVDGVPKVVESAEGGLLGLALDPNFKTNQYIYFSYSEAVPGGTTTSLARAQLSGHRLLHLRKIFQALPANNKGVHFGSRLIFLPDNTLLFSVGDHNDRKKAQELDSHLGKILRINSDGSIPKDNPFTGKGRGEIWSYGHRNPQGLALHPGTNEIWESEHGPRGGDEINIIRKGANYGWPVVTFGREYFGPKIGEGTEKSGMESPLYHYTPAIAPSGLSFYTGDKFPKWKGNLFSAALALEHLNRLVLDGQQVIKEERLLKELEKRIRQVRTGPDGFLYLSTDDGYILRLEPDA
jgi:aldose sugar dehydrogenase